MGYQCPSCSTPNRDGALFCNMCKMLFGKLDAARVEERPAPRRTPAAAATTDTPVAKAPLLPSVAELDGDTLVDGKPPVETVVIRVLDRGVPLLAGEPKRRSASDADPAAVEPRRWRGVTLHILGRHHDAIGCLKRALELDPSHVATWRDLALVEVDVGRTEGARRSLVEGLRALSPGAQPELEADVRALLARLATSG
ncbi:MAG: hypothetical protein IT379_22915 [Deltaproteobacteria bacterium]|nr:hypothetical protein [Deltaproteobacteria bacterium]